MNQVGGGAGFLDPLETTEEKTFPFPESLSAIRTLPDFSRLMPLTKCPPMAVQIKQHVSLMSGLLVCCSVEGGARAHGGGGRHRGRGPEQHVGARDAGGARRGVGAAQRDQRSQLVRMRGVCVRVTSLRGGGARVCVFVCENSVL